MGSTFTFFSFFDHFDNFVVVFLEGFPLVLSAVMFAYAPWHFVCQTESCVPPPSTPPSLSSSLNNVRIVCSSLIFSKRFFISYLHFRIALAFHFRHA